MKVQNQKLIILYIFTILIICSLTAVAASSPSDDNIRLWVENAINENPYINPSGINVEVSNGVVTLSGNVINLASKNLADLEAKKIRGVLGVINQLTVSPGLVYDTDIIQNIRHRINNNAAINSQNIVINCSDGNVTLTGDVSSWSEKQEAGLVASEVRGVKNVANELNVNLMFTRSDKAIKNDIQDSLKRDVYLISLPIKVNVVDGFVTLSGSVGSAYEKKLAYDDAIAVENVKNVANDLKVEPWENEDARSVPGYVVTDANLAEDVKDELEQDSRLNPQNLKITASYGNVVLSGSVANYYQKNLAKKDASSVVGVGWVTNNLVLRSSGRDATRIRDDILFDFSADALLWNQDIGVDVNDGDITLSGKVDNNYDREHAVDVASQIRGVKSIKDEITINWRQDFENADLVGQLINRIKSNWLLSSVSKNIHVSVQNGIVTLTGTVYNWGQRDEAGLVALNTKGVKAVDNRIHVEGYDYNWDVWRFKPVVFPEK